MNWEALGAVGEIAGAIAVFVTLGYLAIQVKHARIEAKRALGHTRVNAVRHVLTLGVDDRINSLIVKANDGLGIPHSPFVSPLIERCGLTPEEAQLLLAYEFAWWNYFVEIIPNVNQLTSMERTGFDRSILFRYNKNSGVGRIFFENMRKVTHQNLINYIDNILAQKPD